MLLVKKNPCNVLLKLKEQTSSDKVILLLGVHFVYKWLSINIYCHIIYGLKIIKQYGYLCVGRPVLEHYTGSMLKAVVFW